MEKYKIIYQQVREACFFVEAESEEALEDLIFSDDFDPDLTWDTVDFYTEYDICEEDGNA